MKELIFLVARLWYKIFCERVELASDCSMYTIIVIDKICEFWNLFFLTKNLLIIMHQCMFIEFGDPKSW